MIEIPTLDELRAAHARRRERLTLVADVVFIGGTIVFIAVALSLLFC